MRSVKSMLMTLGCTGIILGAGYLGIVESGRQILRSESIPEKAECENTSSNIFYGKIEDDIEIFPWNYYPEEQEGEKNIFPGFMEDEIFLEQYLSKADNIPEAELLYAADWYLGQLIAYETGADEKEIQDWFQTSNRHVLSRMVMTDNLSVGCIYFYQDILTLQGKQYQVRIACNDWSVISFICVEYDAQKQHDKKKWEEGKEKVVAVLEQSGESLEELFSYMAELYYMGDPSIYRWEHEYENGYLKSLQWLENIMEGEETSLEEIEQLQEEWGISYDKEKNVAQVDASQETEDIVSYSYQVVELKNMILLLIQGETTQGVYYDPVNQKFCGYNYFY